MLTTAILPDDDVQDVPLNNLQRNDTERAQAEEQKLRDLEAEGCCTLERGCKSCCKIVTRRKNRIQLLFFCVYAWVLSKLGTFSVIFSKRFSFSKWEISLTTKVGSPHFVHKFIVAFSYFFIFHSRWNFLKTAEPSKTWYKRQKTFTQSRQKQHKQ